MEGTYPVCLGKEEVGQASVERQGLYYHFRCRCQVQSEIIYKVVVCCDGVHTSLGILVPAGKEYILAKRLPVRQFHFGRPEFWILPKRPQNKEIYVDVYPEEPFQYITKLEKAYLDKRRDRTGIRIQID